MTKGIDKKLEPIAEELVGLMSARLSLVWKSFQVKTALEAVDQRIKTLRFLLELPELGKTQTRGGEGKDEK